MDIKKTIKEHGYTLERVASEMKPKGITKGALSQMINNNPTVETLRRIAAVIGCEVGDFFSDERTEYMKCPYCGKSLKIRIE
jgi:transcriptional regulator with XRE-family HTH domain